MEHQAAHVIGDIGKAVFRARSLDADGADKQADEILLLGEHVIDRRTHSRLRRVASADMVGRRLARRLLAMDTAYQRRRARSPPSMTFER